ncbi:MAG: hypothetical protein ACPGO3_02705 [Magnetospiraceae bacterium]
MYRTAVILVAALAALAGVLVLAALALGAIRYESRTGYYGPVFDADGTGIYTIRRDARGIVLGFGWEMLTPPARVYVLTDRLSLRRISLADGAEEVLETWDETPLSGSQSKEYQGRIFGYPQMRLEAAEGQVSYLVRYDRRDADTTPEFRLAGIWKTDGGGAKGNWITGTTYPPGLGSPVLSGRWEVVSMRDSEGMPGGILLVDEKKGETRLLKTTAPLQDQYPHGLTAPDYDGLLRRTEIERLQLLTDTRRDLIAKFTAEGMNEGAATLAANTAMQEMNLLPRPPSLTATPVPDSTAEGRTVFDISAMEFTVGLFADIAQAISHPGTAVEKGGTYLRHQDFDTSERLNQWLADGNRKFLIRTDAGLFELNVTRYSWPGNIPESPDP